MDHKTSHTVQTNQCAMPLVSAFSGGERAPMGEVLVGSRRSVGSRVGQDPVWASGPC